MASGQGSAAPPAYLSFLADRRNLLISRERKNRGKCHHGYHGLLIFVLLALVSFILLGTWSEEPHNRLISRESPNIHLRAKVRKTAALAGGYKKKIAKNIVVECSDDDVTMYGSLFNITLPPTPSLWGAPVPSPGVPPKAEEDDKSKGWVTDGAHAFGRADDEDELKTMYRNPEVPGDETFTREEKEALMKAKQEVETTNHRSAEETIKMAEKAQTMRELAEEKRETETIRVDPETLNDTNPGSEIPRDYAPGHHDLGGGAPGASTPGSGYSSDYFGDLEHAQPPLQHEEDGHALEPRDNSNAGHTPFPGHTPIQGRTAAASPHPEPDNDTTPAEQHHADISGDRENSADLSESPAIPGSPRAGDLSKTPTPGFKKPEHLSEMAERLGLVDEDEAEYAFPLGNDDDDRYAVKDDAVPLPPPDCFSDPPNYNQDPLIAFFEPGPLGIVFDGKGRIVEVKKDSQAQKRGVTPGMRLFRIKTTFIPLNASKNAILGLLTTCIRGSKRYPITFLAPPLTIPPSPAPSTPPTPLPTSTPRGAGVDWVLLGSEEVRPNVLFGGVTHVAHLYAEKSTIPPNYIFNRSDSQVLSKCPIRFALLLNRTKQAGDQEGLLRMVNNHLARTIEEARHPRRWLSNSLSNAVKGQPTIRKPRRPLISCCSPCCSPIDESECGPEIRIEIHNQVVEISHGENNYGALHNPVLSQGILEMVLGRGDQCKFIFLRVEAVRELSKYSAAPTGAPRDDDAT